MNNERINKLIDTPFDRINPVNYDEAITELQRRLKKAEEVIEAADSYMAPHKASRNHIYENTLIKALRKYQEGDV